MIETNKKYKLLVIFAILFFLMVSCNDYNSNFDTLKHEQITSERAKDNANKIMKNGYTDIVIENQNIFVEQIDMLANKWTVSEALFANKLINEPDVNNIGNVFFIESGKIIFDNKEYDIEEINIFSSEDMYREYSLNSTDARIFSKLTVINLKLEENSFYEKLDIMIEEDMSSVYCYIHKNELETGFYKATE